MGRELDHNLSLLSKWTADVEKLLRQVASDDRSVYSFFMYTNFQRSFIQQAFALGIIYERLSDEDVSTLNNVLLHFDQGIMAHLNGSVKQWQNATISKADMSKRFEFELQEINKMSEQLMHLRAKLA